jgi:stage II sporulation protein GA (sporulation sigma-E factor processing peptidase)
MLIGAAIGGIYAVLMFYPRAEWAFSTFAKLIFSLGLVWGIFGNRSLKEYAKTIVIFYFVTFAMAGAVYGFMSLAGITGETFPLKTLAISIIISYACITAITYSYRRKTLLERNIGALKIRRGDECVELSALADSGNELPIAIAEFAGVKKLFPKEFCAEFERCKKDDYIALSELIKTWKNEIKLKVVPFTSIGKRGGLILGFVADSEFAGKVSKGQVIGLYAGKLSGQELYQAIF